METFKGTEQDVEVEGHEAVLLDRIVSRPGIELIGPAGEGGFSKVYRVRTGSGIQAAKIPSNECVETIEKKIGGNISIVEEEAKILQGLNHPNIVPFDDFRDGVLYMRLMKGHTIREGICKFNRRIANKVKGKRRYTVKEIKRVRDGVGSAIEYLASKGIVHRDLNSGNIMFAKNPKIFDFGVSKAFEEATRKIEEKRGEFTITGTPGYIAPEVTFRAPKSRGSDLYGLGVVLYVMAKNRPALDGIRDARLFVPWRAIQEDVDGMKRLPETLKGSIKILTDNETKIRAGGLRDAWYEGSRYFHDGNAVGLNTDY
jgi:serine/threonine protein kinase